MLNSHSLSRQEFLGLLQKAPVATLWHPINKYSPTLQLVGRCIQILKDTCGTSDYNNKWGRKDSSTQTDVGNRWWEYRTSGLHAIVRSQEKNPKILSFGKPEAQISIIKSLLRRNYWEWPPEVWEAEWPPEVWEAREAAAPLQTLKQQCWQGL